VQVVGRDLCWLATHCGDCSSKLPDRRLRARAEDISTSGSLRGNPVPLIKAEGALSEAAG
jgi:hypothetical protein